MCIVLATLAFALARLLLAALALAVVLVAALAAALLFLDNLVSLPIVLELLRTCLHGHRLPTATQP